MPPRATTVGALEDPAVRAPGHEVRDRDLREGGDGPGGVAAPPAGPVSTGAPATGPATGATAGRLSGAWRRWGVWLLPVLVVAAVVTLGVLRISGTSAGVYDEFLDGRPSQDLLFAEPQPIRSDEWLVMTQLTVAQAAEGFPAVNPNIGDGRDVSVIVDVPYRDWSTAFRPQNLGFFVLPLDVAFAVKWWALGGALVLSAYAFCLTVLGRRPLLASLFALGLGLSPMIAWWYWSVPVLAPAYGLLIAVLGSRVLRGKRVVLPGAGALPLPASHLIHGAALAYVAACLGLLLYPPVQIPVGIIVVAWLVGEAAQVRWVDRTAGTRALVGRTAIVTGAAVAALGVVGAFVLTRREVIDAVLGSTYPGVRSYSAGGYPETRLLDSFLQPVLQSGAYPAANASESANYLLFLPYLLLPGLVLAGWLWLRRRHVDWPFLSLNVVVAVFLAYLFLPWSQPLVDATQLAQVPQQRLLMGIGLAGFMHLVHLVRMIEMLRAGWRLRVLAAAWAAGCLGVVLLVGARTVRFSPQFVDDLTPTLVYGLPFVAVILFLLAGLARLAAATLLGLSVAAVAWVHPLYVGLGHLGDTPVVDAIAEVSSDEEVWATVDGYHWENFALLAGRPSASGVQIYPDVEYWRPVVGERGDRIVNRYAHAFFSANPRAPDLQLTERNQFQVAFRCDEEFVVDRVDWVLSGHRMQNSCTQLVRVVRYDSYTFYLSRVVDPAEGDPDAARPAEASPGGRAVA
ncbi:MAG: hypothetical protein ACFCVG_01510 [Kineosporiaceae bacterium]